MAVMQQAAVVAKVVAAVAAKRTRLFGPGHLLLPQGCFVETEQWWSGWGQIDLCRNGGSACSSLAVATGKILQQMLTSRATTAWIIVSTRVEADSWR